MELPEVGGMFPGGGDELGGGWEAYLNSAAVASGSLLGGAGGEQEDGNEKEEVEASFQDP